jgi:hypothetical protein
MKENKFLCENMRQASIIYQSNKLLHTIIDYLFWSFLILFTNPGGIVNAFNAFYIYGKVNINDLLFVLLSICYAIIPKGCNIFDTDFKTIRNFLFIFLIYYFIVFVYLVPIYNGNKDYSFLVALIKSRWTIYSIFLFIYVYEFFKRRPDIFIKFFTYSSLFIITLFLFQLVLHLKILPTLIWPRNFIKINRFLMQSTGFMMLFIPMGITILIFKLNIKLSNLILLSFFLMSIYTLITLERRDILGIFIYFILATILKLFLTTNYKLFFYNILKSIFIITFVIVLAYFIFPKYVEASKIAIAESIHVIEYGKTSTGNQDVRLTFNRPFINKQFFQRPLFGTGFDNRWRTGKGDELGYEASDYPFLAALAMFGIIGLIIFLPVYIELIKILKKDFNYLRTQNVPKKTFWFLFLITFMLFFTFYLLQYFNWFYPISTYIFYYWYSFLGLYLASRYIFYSLQFNNNKYLNFKIA